MYSLYSPDLSLKYEMNLPSGLQAGSRSAEPDELEMLRTSPFSAGIVKISPRASTTARFPVGDNAMETMRDETSFHCGIIHGNSPATVIGTTCSRPVFGSSSWMYPACSNTTAPAPASSVFTSKSAKCVTCATFFVLVSYDQTLATPSASSM